MKIVVLPEARTDIQRLQTFLVERGQLEAAEKALLAIHDGLETLKTYPYSGVRMPERKTDRQLFVSFGRSAYVLRYRIDEARDTLAVVRIWHGREDRR